MSLASHRGINVYDLFAIENLVLLQGAIPTIHERLGLMLEEYQILRRPIITEKSSTLKDNKQSSDF